MSSRCSASSGLPSATKPRALGQPVRAAGQLGDRRGDAGGRHAVEVGETGRRIVPAGVFVPGRPHVPGHLAVLLGELQLRRRLHLAHQGAQVDAGVHTLDGAVMHPLHRVDDAGDLALDVLGPADVLVAGEHQLGLQRAERLGRVDELQRPARLVAAKGVEVRMIAEHRAEQVADDGDLLVRQPDDHGRTGLAARRPDDLEPAAAQFERMAVVADQQVRRDLHGRDDVLGLPSDAAEHPARAAAEMRAERLAVDPVLRIVAVGDDRVLGGLVDLQPAVLVGAVIARWNSRS
jgi:hypothetical protein